MRAKADVWMIRFIVAMQAATLALALYLLMK